MKRLTSGFVVLAIALVATPEAQSKPLKLGFADPPLYLSSNADTRQKWLGKTKKAGASIARIDVHWSSIAAAQPLSPTNPNDPAYVWGTLDSAIADANAEGLDPLLTVSNAPGWAEGPNRDGNAPSGTWKPDADAFGDFGSALAARYGSQVRYYQAWNEPNIYTFLNPQYEGDKLVGADIYRRLLNAFYSGVHDADSSAFVISGGTAPYGDPAGGRRTRPLTFLRDLLCLDGKNKPKSCDTKSRLDALAHHPINTSGGPNQSAVHPDDASTPDLKHVVEILRKAEKANKVATDGRHEVWVTEFWWETNPPDNCTGVGVNKQAKWIGKALKSFKKQGASVAINYTIRDMPYQPADCGRASYQSGAFFSDGEKKPSFNSFKKYAK